MFSQVAAPAPGLRVQSPCRAGCPCLGNMLPSCRSGSCSPWAPLFLLGTRPGGHRGAGLPRLSALLLRTTSVLPACLPADLSHADPPMRPSLSPPRAPGRPSVLRGSEPSPCLLGILCSSGGCGKGYTCWLAWLVLCLPSGQRVLIPVDIGGVKGWCPRGGTVLPAAVMVAIPLRADLGPLFPHVTPL